MDGSEMLEHTPSRLRLRTQLEMGDWLARLARFSRMIGSTRSRWPWEGIYIRSGA